MKASVLFLLDDPNNEFTIPLDRTKIDEAMGAGMQTIKKQLLDGSLVDTTIQNDRKTDEVKQILVKEKWFFDKNHSVMNVRIIGICPIRVYAQLDDAGMPTDVLLKKQTFWVYFPELRPLFARHEMFNDNNDAQRISYDDYFIQRRFNSYIFAESNVYSNRVITSYCSWSGCLSGSRQRKRIPVRNGTRSLGILNHPGCCYKKKRRRNLRLFLF